VESGKFACYLPFIMVIPYLCGRLMRVSGIVLSRIMLIADMAILPPLLIDRFTSSGGKAGHWPFFGQDHDALLVGGAVDGCIAYVLRTRSWLP